MKTTMIPHPRQGDSAMIPHQGQWGSAMIRHQGQRSQDNLEKANTPTLSSSICGCPGFVFSFIIPPFGGALLFVRQFIWTDETR